MSCVYIYNKKYSRKSSGYPPSARVRLHCHMQALGNVAQGTYIRRTRGGSIANSDVPPGDVLEYSLLQMNTVCSATLLLAACMQAAATGKLAQRWQHDTLFHAYVHTVQPWLGSLWACGTLMQPQLREYL